MESSLETTLNALNEQLARLNDQLAQNQLTLTHINARLDDLELESESDPVTPLRPREAHPDRARDPNPREVP